MEILTKLFGNNNKVRAMRFFIFNPEAVCDVNEVSALVKVGAPSLRREINCLEDMGFVDAKIISRPNARGDRKIKVRVWQLNAQFPFVKELRNILNYDILDQKSDIGKKFKHCGRVKAIILSGLFLSDPDGRVDLTVIGDALDKKSIERVIHRMEAEIGKELKFAILETEDFQFRLFSGDKFVRDIYDYPYEYALNKIDLP